MQAPNKHKAKLVYVIRWSEQTRQQTSTQHFEITGNGPSTSDGSHLNSILLVRYTAKTLSCAAIRRTET